MKIKTASVIGPCMAIPVTPQLVIAVVNSMSELENRHCRIAPDIIDNPEGPIEELVVGLYNAFTSNDDDNEDEDDANHGK